MSNLSDVQLRHWVKARKPVARAQGKIPGLTFTQSAKGVATWILRYRFAGKPRELTIGRYPDFSITRAKAEALEARVKIQQGVDVAREKQHTKVESAAAMSFRQLADDYIHYCRRINSTRIVQTIHSGWLPFFVLWNDGGRE